MADEVLSQAELEMLFSTLDPDVTSGTSPPSQTPREPVVPYDFKRPQSLSKEQLRALETLHEAFGHNFAAALGGLLRSPLECSVASVDSLTYGEFISRLESPTCFNLLRAAPTNEPLLLEISPAILYPLIDRLLGGGGEATPLASRPPTEIEWRLAARMTGLFLQELRKAWRGARELDFSVLRVDSDPQAVGALPPGEPMAAIRFELTLHQARGHVSLCFGASLAGQIGDAVLNAARLSHAQASDETIEQVGQQLREAVVEIVAHLAETKITPADMFNLHVGDIIATEKDARSPIAVSLQGIPKFRAHPGAFKGHKAIRIEEPLEPNRGAPRQ